MVFPHSILKTHPDSCLAVARALFGSNGNQPLQSPLQLAITWQNDFQILVTASQELEFHRFPERGEQQASVYRGWEGSGLWTTSIIQATATDPLTGVIYRGNQAIAAPAPQQNFECM